MTFLYCDKAKLNNLYMWKQYTVYRTHHRRKLLQISIQMMLTYSFGYLLIHFSLFCLSIELNWNSTWMTATRDDEDKIIGILLSQSVRFIFLSLIISLSFTQIVKISSLTFFFNSFLLVTSMWCDFAPIRLFFFTKIQKAANYALDYYQSIYFLKLMWIILR